MSCVIVALPREGERVLEISSEKKPHLTLLFLGEVDQPRVMNLITSFVEHAAEMSLRRFGLSVNKRGTLGDNDADVLFFEKNAWDMKSVSEFRNMLLQDPTINVLYNSAEQYPSWTPHLTLGYPETPAKKDPDIDPYLRYIDFDRIAVWFGDSEGPEFELKSYFSEGEVAMSELQHYGVKGMKWGVRRDGELAGVSRSTNREAKKDADEFARAKMFYGQGAGTRRKLIKARVEAKSKRDPSYKKAFDHHLENQDLSKRASQARSERRRKDAASSTTKTVKGVHRQLTGGFGTVSLASAVIAAAYVGARKAGVDQIIFDAARTKLSEARSPSSTKQAEDFLRRMGL